MEDRFAIFTTLISKINRNIRKLKNIEMTEYNLRSQHVVVLYHLYMYGPLTSKELVERCEEDKATISRGLKYLEENDFVSCNITDKKRYNTEFFLLEKGKVVGEVLANKINTVLDEVDRCITDEERKDLYIYLNKISDSLESLTKGE